MRHIYIVAILFVTQGFACAFQGTEPFENYLNSIKTLSGNFTQVSNKGRTLTGTIQISRPGKLRLQYNPPSELVVISDGKWLINYDREADETTYLTLEKTPAAFILRPKIRFSGDVAITSVVPQGDTTEITLIRTEEPEEGYITLVFDNDPVRLTEWKVVDANGVQTRVILSEMQSNVNLPAGLFNVKSPNLIQQIF
jgi:outer membrane lipoprotein-sorting protein